jgi:hypothetical protein
MIVAEAEKEVELLNRDMSCELDAYVTFHCVYHSNIVLLKTKKEADSYDNQNYIGPSSRS